MAEEHHRPSSPASEAPTATAADLKAAAQLSSLNAHAEDVDPDASRSSGADTAALGAAVSNLAGGKEGTGITAGGDEGAAAREVERRKAVKIDQGDVTFLVEELEVTKFRATELLRSHDGSRIAAIKSYVMPRRRDVPLAASSKAHV